jgi:hypothetical protein
MQPLALPGSWLGQCLRIRRPGMQRLILIRQEGIEGGRRPVGADQRHSDTSLLATTARLSAIMHVHQRLAC